MRRQPVKGIESRHIKYREMPHVSGKHRQFVGGGDRSYRGIGKPRRLTAGSCPVKQPAQDSRGAHVQFQYPRTV